MINIILLCIFAIVFFLAGEKFYPGCKPILYDKCKINTECCSGNCSFTAASKHGICKPAVSTEVCKPVGFNQCTSNSHCCSDFCYKPASWQFGVCESKPHFEPAIATASVQECKKDGYDKCNADHECCSDFCEKDPSRELGVCKEHSETNDESTENDGEPKDSVESTKKVLKNQQQNSENSTKIVEECKPLWYNKCKINSECCSANCSTIAGQEYGVCSPAVASELCKPLWYNKCNANSQCCSNFCFKEPAWEFGVCEPYRQKPVTETAPRKCHKDYESECTSDTECCSNYCDEDPRLGVGVCKPPKEEIDKKVASSESCKPLWFNQCTSHSQCCSNFCFKPALWHKGVCEPKPRPVDEAVTEAQECQKDGYDECNFDHECCSKFCDKEDATKGLGVCKQPGEKNNKKVNSSEPCKPLWFNQCTSNFQCCSKFCFKPVSWHFGVCQEKPQPKFSPEPGKHGCPKDDYSPCTSDTDCCSDFCDREARVCKPSQEKTDEYNKICESDGFDACNSNANCCSGFCDTNQNSQFGVCKPILAGYCEPLASRKLKILCFTANGTATPCDKPIPANSTATFSCNPSSHVNFTKPEYDTIHCENGRWDLPLLNNFCHVECGISISKSDHEEFPWHAAVYEKKADSWFQICGGTLISHRVVISAAHCFDVEDRRNLKNYLKNSSLFKIAVGKYFRDLHAREDGAQIADVENIIIPDEYSGSMSLYANDIAFITLKTPIQYTNSISPVCIDTNSEIMEEDQLVQGTLGKIMGWGLTEEQKSGEILAATEIPFLPADHCSNQVSHPLLPYLRNDKLCAGDPYSSVNVCKGDSGGGLVFKDGNSSAYYLVAVVALGPKGCQGRDFALFTKLSAHKKLVRSNDRLLKSVCDCDTKYT